MTASSPHRVSSQANLNTNTTVAFLGPVNSYSHQATKTAFPEPEWRLEPTGTIKEVFDRVQAGQAAYGVVPFENSTHGTVAFTLDNLADRAGEYAEIVVCDEVYLDVHHFLLGRRRDPLLRDPSPGSASASASAAPSAAAPSSPDPSSPPPARDGSSSSSSSNSKGVPLASLSHIRRVYSHPQAFGQTGAFVRRYLAQAETVEVSSTSRAAELAAADPAGESAAIASEWAGRGFGLDVLARWVEDREDNTTRFFVLGKDGEAGEGGRAGGGEEGKGREDEDDAAYSGARYKSLASFTVPHRQPGALADVLDCFRGRGLNLTSINSVPSLVEPFQYLFFVEFEGSRLDDPEGRVGGVLEDLNRVAERWRWLGSWRNRRSGR
ncbi:Prephenate dehydratase-domain-containing protein [Thermothelomyces heterothallicus CBS 202.75]|uniref:Prephenate dehydratase-domain-containing protein n=1 Tax=Thermothelomyces heterothallicus CBS 202.75 TaxID=1149848 RepID=UPI0037435B73